MALEGVLHSRADRLQGIVNGVDYAEWDPATDKLLAANYTPANLHGKEACKQALLEKMGARNSRAAPAGDWHCFAVCLAEGI